MSDHEIILIHVLLINGPINFLLLVANCSGIKVKGNAILKNTCENTNNCSIFSALPLKMINRANVLIQTIHAGGVPHHSLLFSNSSFLQSLTTV